MEQATDQCSSWLPPDYSAQAADESRKNFLVISAKLAEEVRCGDFNRGVRFWLRNLDSWLDLSDKESRSEFRSQLATLARVLLSLLRVYELDPNLRAKWAHTLAKLLRKCDPEALTLSWRDLYELMMSQFPNSREGQYRGKATHAFLAGALRSVVVKARRFFGAEAFGEIVQQLDGSWCPHDNVIFRTQALASLFLPGVKRFEHQQQQFIEDVLARWPLLVSSEWDYHWLALLSRLAKSTFASQGKRSCWEPFLPELYTHALRILDLSLGGSKLPKPKKRSYPHECYILSPNHMDNRKIKALAKLIVYSLSAEPAAISCFERLMLSIEPYYYPSNSGDWSDRLAQLLKSLCEYYTKRVFKEKKTGDALLGATHHERFVSAVKRSLLHSLFSKGEALPTAAKIGFQHLAYVAPALVLPDLVETLYLALDSATMTHQTVCAIETLSHITHALIAEPSYSDGIQHLSSLLQLALPGLDPNDARKTGATMAFYVSFLSSVPLIPGDTDKCSETSLALCLTLQEWAPLLLQRLFILFEHMEEPSKENHAQYYYRKLFQSLSEQLFMQSSPELSQTLLKQLGTFLTRNTFLNAKKEVGLLVSASSYANPDVALSSLLPLIWSRILNKSKEALKDNGDSEMEWYIHALAAAVKRSGAALLKHRQELRTFCALGLKHASRKVVKATMKVLRNVLKALCCYYPVDYRSVPPVTWQSSEFLEQPWKWWGHQAVSSQSTIQWHQPGLDELDMAMDFATTFLEEPKSFLSTFSTASAEGTAGRQELWKNLHLLRAVLRGTATLLPEITEPKEKTDQVPMEDWFVQTDEEERDENASVSFVSAKFSGLDLSRVASMRSEVASVLHELCLKLLASDNDTHLPLLCKVFDVALNLRGQLRYGKLKWRKNIYKMSKAKYSAISSKGLGHGTLPRRLLVERAYIKHLAREQERLWRVPYSAVHRLSLADLIKMSTHSSPTTRQQAQTVVHATLRHLPMWKRGTVEGAIAKLAQKDLPEEEIVGSIRLLMNKGLIRYIWRDWRLLSSLMLALANGYIHEEVRIQNHFTELFLLFCVTAYALPLETPLASSLEWLSREAMPLLEGGRGKEENHTKVEERIRFYNGKDAERYKYTVQSLLDVVENNRSLHWRYQIVVASCQLFLLRKAPLTDMRVVKWLLEGTVSDIQGLRLICRMALSQLLKIWKPSPESNTSSYQDSNSRGWAKSDSASEPAQRGPEPRVSVEDRTKLTQVLHAFFSEANKTKKFMDYLAQDHDVKGESSEGLAERVMKSVRRTGRGSSISDLLQQDIAIEIMKTLQFSVKQWPPTIVPTFALPTNSFSFHNAHLFKGLFQVMEGGTQEDCLSKWLEPILLDYTSVSSSTEEAGSGDMERRHCTAAEAFSAMVRASKHFAPEKTERVWALWLPLLRTMILSAPLDCSRDWLVALRFAISKLDVRRVEPLCDFLLSQLSFLEGNVEEISTVPSLVHCRAIQFVTALFAELTWRGAALAPRVLALMGTEKGMKYPYRQVRQEIAQLLLLLFQSTWRSSDPMEHCSLVIEQLSTLAAAPETNKSTSYAREIMLHFITTGVEEIAYPIVPYLPQLLKPSLAVVTDPDRELVAWAKKCVALEAQVIFPTKALLPVVSALQELLQGEITWHSRAVLLPFLQIFIYNHSFLLSHEQSLSLQEAVISCLFDQSIEVRELACSALTSLAMAADAAEHDRLKQSFLAILRDRSKGKGPSASPQDIKRHGGALGLLALVQSSPYSVPGWLPQLLVDLAPFDVDPATLVRQTIKNAFTRFWQTHLDMWPLFEKHFDREQLSLIKQFGQSTSSYYL